MGKRVPPLNPSRQCPAAPRTQEPKAGGLANNQSREWEKDLPLSENVGENVAVKKKKPNKFPRGQVLYGCALEIKPTRE